MSSKNLEVLDKLLRKYIAVARTVGGARSSKRRAGSAATRQSSATGGVDPKAVRACTVANGGAVSSRARISTKILERFQAAAR